MASLIVSAGNQVAGDLLDRESIERYIPVQRFDDPVPPAPSIWAESISPIAIAVCVAGLIEPMTSPFFTVVGAGQQAIDQALPGARLPVGEKGGEFIRRGRQACEVKSRSPNERGGVSFRRRRNTFPFEPCQNEAVDSIWYAGCVIYLRHGVPLDRAQRP